MTFTKNEREYLKILVARDLDHFVKEKIARDESIVFLKGEDNYEDFLRSLKKKLED